MNEIGKNKIKKLTSILGVKWEKIDMHRNSHIAFVPRYFQHVYLHISINKKIEKSGFLNTVIHI